MAWTDLKSSVAAVIKANGNQEITGALLQSTLNSIIDQVGANATFKGIATPETIPGTPDGPVFYLAFEKGVYSNFSGHSVFDSDGFVVLLYSSVWVKYNIPMATKTELSQLADDVEQLDTGLSQLADDVEQLGTGLSQLAGEVEQLDEDLGNAVDRIETLETLQQTEHVCQNPDWNTLFTRNGYFVFADDVTGENRPDGLPVPAGKEVIYYNVVSAGKNGISGHNNPTLIIQRHGTLEVYFVSMGDDSILAAIRVVDAGELVAAMQSINNAFSSLDQVIEDITTELGSKASDEDLGNAVDRIETLETLQQTEHVCQNPDWNTLFTRNGYFVFADDVTGEHRPEGLPVPSGQEVIYYNVVSVGRIGEAGPNQPTLILQRHWTMEVYFVTLAGDSRITATGLVDSAELASAISAINDEFASINDVILDMATDISNITAEMGSIDTILDILNGDLEGDIQEIIDNMVGV